LTEAEWLACSDPEAMLEFVRRTMSVRKKRLFACACCRLVWESLPSYWRRALETSEAFIEGMASEEQLKADLDAAMNELDLLSDAAQAVWWACNTSKGYDIAGGASYRVSIHDRKTLRTQAALVRDIFQPFPHVKRKQRWADQKPQQIAQSIYADRAFEHLPILADALEEAGCTDAAILEHCRGPGPHIRGCWVVDLLTGRK
jgi:hypothetical protein